MDLTAYFGDERPLKAAIGLWQFHLLQQIFHAFELAASGWLACSLCGLALIRRHQPDVVMVEFGFEAVRVMEACAWSGVPLVVHFRDPMLLHGLDWGFSRIVIDVC